MCTAAIREAEAHCTTMIQDAEVTCTAAIRDAKATCADHTHTLQQSHGVSMQDIEREAIEEEERDCQSFLTACRVALQVCPPETCGILMYPLQLLMGNMSLATLLVVSPSHPPQWGTYTCISPSNCISGTCAHLRNQTAKHHLPNQEVTLPQSGDEEAAGTLKELPNQKWKNGMLLGKLLKRGQ